MFSLPDAGRPPVHPFDAAHAVASVELQASTADSPALIVAGTTLSKTVGGGLAGAVTVTVTLAATDPPPPEQFSE